MINWLLVQLLNQDTAAYQAEQPTGEVYPSEYYAVPAPAVTDRLRSVLFHGALNGLAKQCRFRQLATIVHSTPLAELLRDRDARQTYWPLQDEVFYGVVDVENVTNIYRQLKDTLSDNDEQELFGTSPVGPYLSLQNTWRQHPLMWYQLAALVLAVAMRTEDGA